MLKPSMQELMKRVGNRYLLVNLTAQRARDIADHANAADMPLQEKAVKLALDEIAAGTVVYRPGPRANPVIVRNNPIAASIVDLDDSMLLDEDDIEVELDEDRDEELDDELGEREDSYGDDDIPEEDE